MYKYDKDLHHGYTRSQFIIYQYLAILTLMFNFSNLQEGRYQLSQKNPVLDDDFLHSLDHKVLPSKIPDDALLNFTDVKLERMTEKNLSGQLFPLVLSQIINPGKFYFNLYDGGQFDEVHDLMSEMDNYYNSFRGEEYKVQLCMLQ